LREDPDAQAVGGHLKADRDPFQGRKSLNAVAAGLIHGHLEVFAPIRRHVQAMAQACHRQSNDPQELCLGRDGQAQLERACLEWRTGFRQGL
jgi:hypothetical protein